MHAANQTIGNKENGDWRTCNTDKPSLIHNLPNTSRTTSLGRTGRTRRFIIYADLDAAAQSDKDEFSSSNRIV
jgi:hypothetical protein